MDKIKVYDVCSFVKEKYPEYCTYRNIGIIEGNDKFIVTDNEAIHHIYNVTEKIEITIYDSERKKEDGKTTISIMPCGTLKISLSELEKEVEYKEIEWEDFFSRRNYNPRLQTNYSILLRSVMELDFTKISI